MPWERRSFYFPGSEKPLREGLAGEGDGRRVLEPDAGANGHLRTDAFAIAEVFLEEGSCLSCDITGNGVFRKLRQRVRQMQCLGEPKQPQNIETVLVLQTIWNVFALGDLVQLGDPGRRAMRAP